MYYVATRFQYVLVEAPDENAARGLGKAALDDLYAGVRKRLGSEVPIQIRAIRPATENEIAFWRSDNEALSHVVGS